MSHTDLGSAASSSQPSPWLFSTTTTDDGCCYQEYEDKPEDEFTDNDGEETEDGENELMIVLDPQEIDEVSVLSFENLPDDTTDEASSVGLHSMASMAAEPLEPLTNWEPQSYSLYCMAHNWFRLAHNHNFHCALYLQGRKELLHTMRGIFKTNPHTVFYLVPMENNRMLRLDKSSYKSVLSTRRYVSLDGAGSLTSISLSSARSKQMYEI